MGLGFIAEGKIVAAISDDQTIRLWNTADGKLLQTIEGNDNSSISTACIFSSQNDRSAISSQNDRSAIAVANSDENRINLWSLSLEELLKNSTNQICDYTKRQNV
jgi:WD40 repeat protein